MKKNNKNKNKNKSLESIYVIVFFVIFSLIFLSIYSCCTSIFYKNYVDIDGSTFQVIGKSWLNGHLPYRDVFDHKAPIIYFINMIGFFIGQGSNAGIMFLQIVSMTFTTYGLFKINSIKIKNKIINIFVVIFITSIWLILGYETGNKTEEWCMPFLVYSLYFSLKFFDNYYNTKLIVLDKYVSLFFGLTSGFCLMMKFTNIIPVMPFIAIIYVLFFINKKYNELVKHILWFLLGIVIMSLPFFIYFFANGIFSDFIYCSFSFQYKYLKMLEQIQDYNINILSFLRYYFPLWLIIPISIKYIINKRYLYVTALILVFLLESYVLYFSLRGTYYVAILMPIFAIALNEMFDFLSKKRIDMALLIVLPLAFITIFLYRYNNINFEYSNDPYIIDILDKVDSESLVCYDLKVGTTNYIELFCKKKTAPVYKYYFQQSFFSRDKDEAMKIHNIYQNGNAEYILVFNRLNPQTIDNILNTRYIDVYNNPMYKLYKLK